MKLWGGRFEKKTDGLVDDFHSSITFDKRLYHQDIAGSIPHATMLGEQGIIPQADADAIVEGLTGIEADIAAGKVQFELDAEDIHMNVEKLLIERIENDEVFRRKEVKVWVCTVCGHIEIGTEPPEKCPVCEHPQGYFEIKAENF